LVVTDRAEVFAVQLIELNLFGRLDRVIDAHRNRNQQETYVAFPNRTHRDPPLGAPTSLSAVRGHPCPPYSLATASGSVPNPQTQTRASCPHFPEPDGSPSSRSTARGGNYRTLGPAS